MAVSAPSMSRVGRVRIALLAGAVLIAAAAAVVVILITSSEAAPATGAASLVPSDALAYIRHYLVIGPPDSVQSAIDAAAGQLQPLSASNAYQRAAAGEPADRVLDAYASPVGLRRLLAPRGGVIAAIGALLYQPALSAVAVSLSPATGGANVRVRSAFDPNVQPTASVSRTQFTPTLDKEMPSGSMLLLDVTGLDRIAPRVLGAGATGGVFSSLGPLLARLGAALQSEGVNVKSIESLFDGETA